MSKEIAEIPKQTVSAGDNAMSQFVNQVTDEFR
jgi:hypothetical protein